MNPQATPGIGVRRDCQKVALENYDVEHGKSVLTRINLLDAETAIQIGRALVHLGEAIERDKLYLPYGAKAGQELVMRMRITPRTRARRKRQKPKYDDDASGKTEV